MGLQILYSFRMIVVAGILGRMDTRGARQVVVQTQRLTGLFLRERDAVDGNDVLLYLFDIFLRLLVV